MAGLRDPPELRAEGRHRVVVHVKGDRFRLTLPSAVEQAESVTLRGIVRPAPGGGSDVRATFQSASPVFWLLIAGAGALTLSSNVAWGLVIFFAATLFTALDEWRDSRIGPYSSPTASCLAARLQAAVERAARLQAAVEHPAGPGA